MDIRYVLVWLVSGSSVTEEAGKIWDMFVEFMQERVYRWLWDYKWLFVIVITLAAIGKFLSWASKHAPSRGRITDVFDVAGHRIEGKPLTRRGEKALKADSSWENLKVISNDDEPE